VDLAGPHPLTAPFACVEAGRGIVVGMQPLTAEEIRSSFVNCSKGEATRLPMPANLATTRWDQLDFLGWSDPGAPRTAYLVAPWRGELAGLVLRVGSAAGRGGRKNMCTLCLTTHSSTDVTLMVAPRPGASGRNGNTVGTYLCTDLACSLYARGVKRPARAQPAETLSQEQKVARLAENLDTFVRRVVEQPA
jgi:FBP C-terminal treble-clef zinc-finger